MTNPLPVLPLKTVALRFKPSESLLKEHLFEATSHLVPSTRTDIPAVVKPTPVGPVGVVGVVSAGFSSFLHPDSVKRAVAERRRRAREAVANM